MGYVLLGALFLGIAYHRETTHKDQDFDRVSLDYVLLQLLDTVRYCANVFQQSLKILPLHALLTVFCQY